MMKRIFPMIMVAFLVFSCDGGDPPEPPVGQSGANAKTSAAATKATVSAFGAVSSGTGLGKPDVSGGDSDGGFVNRAFERLKGVASSSTPSGKLSKALLAHESGHIVTPCAYGGERETTTTGDETNGTTTTVAHQCVFQKIGNIEYFENGTMTETVSTTSLSFTASDFTAGARDVTNSSAPIKIRESKTNGTFSLPDVQIAYCGTAEFWTSGKMSINMTESEYKDENGDGTAEVNEVFTTTNFTASITEEFNAETCAPTKETFVANGTIAFTDNLVPSGENNFSATLTNFKSVIEPVAGGENETLTGTVAVATNCENGTFDISTETPLFYPTNAVTNAVCPTAGKILVRGGGTITAVTFTSTGGVQIDEGNNGGTPDKTFDDCDDADVCKA
jgi:hypothetical protein